MELDCFLAISKTAIGIANAAICSTFQIFVTDLLSDTKTLLIEVDGMFYVSKTAIRIAKVLVQRTF